MVKDKYFAALVIVRHYVKLTSDAYWSRVGAFWRLSDEIITEIVRHEIAPYCTDSSLTMDAGGVQEDGQ